MRYSVIAIEREYASGGSEVGKQLAQKLQVPCYNQEILEKAAQKLNLPTESLLAAEENMTGSLLYGLVAFANASYRMDGGYLSLEQKLAFTEAEIIENLAYNPCVIVGRGAAALLKTKENVLKVFIHADLSARIDRAVNEYGIDPKKAEGFLQKQDKRRSVYFKTVTNTEWKNPDNYHLSLNSGKLSMNGIADILYAACS